jgi:hypothetical protein
MPLRPPRRAHVARHPVRPPARVGANSHGQTCYAASLPRTFWPARAAVVRDPECQLIRSFEGPRTGLPPEEPRTSLPPGLPASENLGHTHWVTACAVTPDGRHVVSASYDKTFKIWELATGRTRATLEGHTRVVTACAVTPDGRHVISASDDKTLKIWELATGRARATLEGHAGGRRWQLDGCPGRCASSLRNRGAGAPANRARRPEMSGRYMCLCTHTP